MRAVADSTTKIEHVFSRRTAPLAISSNPPGAAVVIDGKAVGTTPFATTNMSYGPHDVALSRAGYSDWSGRIDVPAGNNLVEIALTQLEAGLIAFSITPYGDVYVDGTRVAQTVTFFRVKADAGMHSIELRHPAFKPFSREVEVEPGSTRKVEHTFSE